MKLSKLPGVLLYGILAWQILIPPGSLIAAETVKAAAQKRVEQAEIRVPDGPLSAESGVEVRFSSPMVATPEVGQQVQAETVVELDPPIPGIFRWDSTRSGRFIPVGVVPLGTGGTIGLKQGLKNPDGTPVSAERKALPERPLVVKHRHPGYFNSSTDTNRQPVITLFFNDTVEASAVARLGAFSNKSGEKVAIEAYHPLVGELGPNPVTIGTWEEQEAQEKNPADAASEDPAAISRTARSVVRVKPVSPLRIGNDWTLVISQELANAAGKAYLGKPQHIYYGSIFPLMVSRISAVPRLDGPRELQVSFNKPPAELTPEQWARTIRISPSPRKLKWIQNGQQVVARGDFTIENQYEVMVPAGLDAADGISLKDKVVEQVRFEPHEPHLSLPAFDHAQWIGGKGDFRFVTANLKDVSIRIKKAQPETAIYLLNGYATYEQDEKNPGAGHTRLPWAGVPGKPVWEKNFESTKSMDQSERFGFQWDEVLGQKRTPGIYFISVEATVKEQLDERTKLGGQAVVQLSDIGLAWKNSPGESLIFAFSHSLGTPLEGVALSTWSGENEPLEKGVTGADGVARIANRQARWLVAGLGEDLRGVRLDSREMEIDSWAFDIPFSHYQSQGARREMLGFTERPVYQPGETVFFKAISRIREAGALSIPAPQTAKLTLWDPRGREVLNRDIQFTDTGSYAAPIPLPENGVGWYRIGISYPPPGVVPTNPAAPEETGEEEWEGEEEQESPERPFNYYHQFLVQEYQPNSFRITFDDQGLTQEGEKLTVPLKAAYLMGKPLGSMPLTWLSRISMQDFQPEGFTDYRFGPASSNYVFDGAQYRSLPRQTELEPLVTGQGTLKLNEKGGAQVEAVVPTGFGVPGPKRVTVSAEITDLNQQTIANEWQHTLHSSGFYLGVRQPVNAVNAGTPVPIAVVAVTPEGKRVPVPVKGKVVIEQLAWNAVRVQTAGGGTEIRNDLTYIPAGEEVFEASPEQGKEEAWVFHPQKAGTHQLTFSSSDESGRPVRTKVSIDVYAPQQAEWHQEEGVKIELLTDKNEYLPGETARILVKSPFSGMALVSVERERVLYSSLRQVEAGGAIDLLVDEAWQPNAFVSVMQVRGGANDPRSHPQPDYRVGYAPIRVKGLRHLLNVQLEPAQPEFRPRGIVEVSATVRDAAGQPVPNAELAVWAVDEGILSLMPWEVPDPLKVFHRESSLAVRTGISLQRLLPEDPDRLAFANKGFVIGGGGDSESAAPLTRSNFKPTPYWNGMLRTGLDGTVKISFPAPDNLTEFRLAAVASEGSARFGHAESRFKVNQPLMIEPSLPRFANVGDAITLKAVIHNTTEHAGEIKVALSTGGKVLLLDPDTRQPLQASSLERTLNVAAHQSKAVDFPVRFIADGPISLNWKAHCVEAPVLADAVVSTFEAGFAEPLLRDLQFSALSGKDRGRNLISNVPPEILEGVHGKVTVTLSNSRVSEGAGAVMNLLRYPYGCVEQTMSSMLPWLTLRDLKKAMPELNKPEAEIAAAIQRGTDRLLSMQSGSGGLTYWPGEGEPTLWASAHGTIGLLLASRSGANLPPARLDALTAWLSQELRSVDPGDQWGLTQRAYAAYALALAGKSEPGYHEALYAQRNRLDPSARTLLALAIIESAGPEEFARLLLSIKNPDDSVNWWGSETTDAMRVIAFLKLKDPAAGEEMGRLIEKRSPRGDWRNTLSNAWVLMALSLEASVAPPWTGGAPAVVTVDGKTRDIVLPATPASETFSMPFQSEKGLPSLTVSLPEGQRLFARIETSSRVKPGPQPARSSGFGIERTWNKVAPDGALSETGVLQTGDLVQVSLKLTLPDSVNYLVVDDPLPATFEAVNPHFKSMASPALAGQENGQSWFSDYAEIRRDRVLFFSNHHGTKSTFSVNYLARVVAEGTVTVPAAKIEMMYDPARFGISSSQKLTTQGSPDEAVAGR